MNTTEIKRYMSNFSIEKLKDYLGRDIVDTLLEWTPNNHVIFTKARLTSMILTVHGGNILKNTKFRADLLSCFSQSDILSFRAYLKRDTADSNDLQLIINKIASESWKKSEINLHFLRILKLSEDTIPSKKTPSSSIERIDAYDKFYELLDYQYVIRQKVLTVLTSGIPLSRMLLHMPTGTGKTKTAMHIVCHHYCYNLKKKGLIIWLAHTTELLQQAYDTLHSVWKHIGNEEIIVYKLWGDYNVDLTNEPLNGVMVCGLQKLASIASSNQTLFQKLILDARLILFDEAHKASAPETRHIVESFMIMKKGMQDRVLMGLTATPGRTTEKSFDNELLVSMFGNRIISIDTQLMNLINLSKTDALNTEPETNIISYFQNRNILANINKEKLEYPDNISPLELKNIKVSATSNGYDDFTPKALEIIGKHKSRNLRIMQKLRELNLQSIPTIVFACSVQHGQLLSAMLTIEGIPNALVIGNMAAQDRSEAITAFKDTSNPVNILINFAVLTAGFDSTNIKCVFITRPTQSIVLYGQMLGRGLRGPQMGGNKECLLVDIQDNLAQYNENMAFSHFDNYWNI